MSRLKIDSDNLLLRHMTYVIGLQMWNLSHTSVGSNISVSRPISPKRAAIDNTTSAVNQYLNYKRIFIHVFCSKNGKL